MAEHKPYVSAETNMKEFTIPALLLGMILSIILGSANAYLGLKAGMTVAATFPAAVVAMAVLRMMRGTILEENTARTTAAVGEALAAGAIFTIPAFIIGGDNAVWKDGLHYWESTILMLLGGILGVLFVIFLRRVLIEDTSLPFPESVACAEIVKAGQGSQTGAGFVFSSLGLGALIQFIQADAGVKLLAANWTKFIHFSQSKLQMVVKGNAFGPPSLHGGGVFIQTPPASPALMSVGYIIGPKLSSVVFAGGVLAWFLLVPLLLFINPAGEMYLHVPFASGDYPDHAALANMVWYAQVRPLAVGAMLVGAFYTLFKMRKSLGAGIARAFRDLGKIGKGGSGEQVARTERDLPLAWVTVAIFAMIVPIAYVYYLFCHSLTGAIVAALVMTLAGFLFAAVAGFLVGTIGSSNNPISGLTLSTLIIAALLMVAVGVRGTFGVAAVLGVATVVCCSSGVAGDIMQDLKVGHILGGTPWKMQLGCILGVVAAAFVLVIPLQILHDGTPGGLGGSQLPAPQAGLMAMLARGIVGGEMAWPLVGVGAAFSVAMILIGAPSPMLIAVGMYLPITSTAPIFVGGIVKWLVDRSVARRNLEAAQKEKVDNTGVLIASGLIAGEALCGMGLAAYTAGASAEGPIATIYEGAWPSAVLILLIAAVLIYYPLRAGGRAPAPAGGDGAEKE
jgi:putative OPT family oligopeptide transporter